MPTPLLVTSAGHQTDQTKVISFCSRKLPWSSDSNTTIEASKRLGLGGIWTLKKLPKRPNPWEGIWKPTVDDTAVEFMHDLSQPNETTSYCAMWQRCCRGSRWHCSSMSWWEPPKTKTPRVEKCRVCRLIPRLPRRKKGGPRRFFGEPYKKKRKEQKSQTNTLPALQNPI